MLQTCIPRSIYFFQFPGIVSFSPRGFESVMVPCHGFPECGYEPRKTVFSVTEDTSQKCWHCPIFSVHAHQTMPSDNLSYRTPALIPFSFWTVVAPGFALANKNHGPAMVPTQCKVSRGQKYMPMWSPCISLHFTVLNTQESRILTKQTQSHFHERK